MATQTPAKRVAEELKVEFFRNRISQSEVAKAVGSSPSSVSRRLGGDVPLTIDEATRYATVAGLELLVTLSPVVPSSPDGPAGDSFVSGGAA